MTDYKPSSIREALGLGAHNLSLHMEASCPRWQRAAEGDPAAAKGDPAAAASHLVFGN